MVTRLGLYGGARSSTYGDFSQKTPAGGTKTFTGVFTRHSLHTGPRTVYGDFSGKQAAEGTKSFTIVFTRHSLHTGPRTPYGSFVGKIGGGIVPVEAFVFRHRSPAPQRRYKTSKPQGIYLTKG
jgi:hypothetical protein